MIRYRALALLCLLLAVSACSGRQSVPATPESAASPQAATLCLTEDGGSARDRLVEFAAYWQKAMEVADRTPADDLQPAIADLQTVADQVQAARWPGCAEAAKGNFVQFMESVIAGLNAYHAHEPETVYRAHYHAAGEFQDRFFDELFKML